MMLSWQKPAERMWRPTARMLRQVGIVIADPSHQTRYPSTTDLYLVPICEVLLAPWRTLACLTYEDAEILACLGRS